jgi:pimeloyl-ACP methyl ester carboxylesterase
MAALDISSAVVVGGSIGGALAIDFALEFPWLVDGLVLVAPGLSGDDTPDDERTAGLLDMAEAALAAGDLERAVDVQLQAWTPLRTDALAEDRIRSIALDNKHVDTLDWSLSQRLDPPAAGRLAEIRAPTLVIIGDEDAAVMSAIASAIVNGIDGARSVEIQDADHLPNMRQPKRFNDVVLGFLDEVVAAQGAR